MPPVTKAPTTSMLKVFKPVSIQPLILVSVLSSLSEDCELLVDSACFGREEGVDSKISVGLESLVGFESWVCFGLVSFESVSFESWMSFESGVSFESMRFESVEFE
jgi:hypothetical protein